MEENEGGGHPMSSERFYVRAAGPNHWVFDRDSSRGAIGPFDTSGDAHEYAAKLNERYAPRWEVKTPGRIGRRMDRYFAVYVNSKPERGDGTVSDADRDRIVGWLVEMMNAEGIQ